MKKILRLSFANIKKHKKESVLLAVLIIFCITLLASSVSSISGIKRITPAMVKESGCFTNLADIRQEYYSDRYLAFFEEDPGVESYDHTSMVTDILKVKTSAEDSEAELFDISFVPESGERRMETFVTDADFSAAEHPIVLDITNRDKLEIEVGDTLTVICNDKEFTFTLVGFYESGLWYYGTKAVITEDDFAYLENYMERYEVIGINTVPGTDNESLLKEFKAFAQDISVNDLTSVVTVMSYESIQSMNEVNMSLLSFIIGIMAAVIVIAVMIMIRFRIVSDIKEQIVSIGVLEAIGYTSGEITASYIAEYVLIAFISALISVFPAFLLAQALLQSAAASVHYGGSVPAPAVPVIVCIIMVLLFVGITALIHAMAVRKYPPVLAFRKGIETHSFKKAVAPLEKTKGSVHVRLAMKEFLQGTGNIGLTVCITACTVMVLLSFMIGSFFSDPDRILNSICGHELCDIRIEGVVDMDAEAFAAELEEMPEVEQVLPMASHLGVKIDGNDSSLLLEVYEDYAKTSTIVVTEGRLPEHANEAALAVQVTGAQKLSVGDTVTLEFGKVKREYLITGIVNSAVNPLTAYLTTEGFRRMDPIYKPDAFDIYLKAGADKNAVADLLKSRYGKEITEYLDEEVSGDTLEERIRSAADISMAKAMTEQGVSYMEYAIRVGDEIITGSTAAMSIKNLTFVKEENQEIAGMLVTSFAGISIIMMVISAVIVTLILSILMSSTIRKQYRELGIMKGLGYTSKELMFQMAFRIIPAAFIAVVIGTGLSLLLMRVVDAYVAKIAVSAAGTVIMDILIIAFCFISAYISARRIKKITVYELITE